ncbi:organic hydroperoxide resistance protein [Demequina sp. SYSU T00039]|uniref:Organic hydroperoxide resistance protein n=1 Tax=Demequina lignilytica TaxID=3051663 RepID=A0AAW7M1B3_9MICO|nr:organic hydroperoxide resistance protein [Demequina sp. SYSU T00039]MDN4486762.1 organic hydroperoxide resistance protein [Demequina sp. SYSU T00039]
MTEQTRTAEADVDIAPGASAGHDATPKHPKAFYTAEATATGDGRNGRVATSDGLLDLDLVIPNPITKPKKTNPEQLFASGFAACYNSAFQGAAKLMKVRLAESTVTARVGIGPVALNRFGLGVRLHVTATGIDQETAERVAERAEQMCPYSNATRGNIPVEIQVTAK